jgi:hypothetical protein
MLNVKISLFNRLPIKFHSKPVIEIIFNYFRTWKLLVCHQFPLFNFPHLFIAMSPPLDEHLMNRSIIHLTHNSVVRFWYGRGVKVEKFSFNCNVKIIPFSSVKWKREELSAGSWKFDAQIWNFRKKIEKVVWDKD